jgi:hypothetical protein
VMAPDYFNGLGVRLPGKCSESRPQHRWILHRKHEHFRGCGPFSDELLPHLNMAIFLKLLRSTFWARVSHAHGLLLTSAVSVTVSGQQQHGIVSTALHGSHYQKMRRSEAIVLTSMVRSLGRL